MFQYIRKVGLVTSTGELDRFYTGHENLVLICQLAGYSKIAAERLTTLVLQDLGNLLQLIHYSCFLNSCL